MLRKVTLLFVACLVLVLSLLLFATPALASGGKYHPANNQKLSPASVSNPCYNNPSIKNCNGQDPQITHCIDDAYTAASYLIYDTIGDNIGIDELRYSPHCGTNWARTQVYGGGLGNVVASIGYGACYSASYYNGPAYQYRYDGTYLGWTNMIYSPTTVAYAAGYVNGVGGCASI